MLRGPFAKNVTATCLALVSMACESREIVGTGNTNWLILCEATDECPADLACQCNVCSTSCDGVIECRGQDRAPLCDGTPTALAPPDDSALLSTPPEGDALEEAGEAEESLGYCGWYPDDFAEPVPVATTSTSVPTTSAAIGAVADASGLYWFERSGRVMATSIDGSGEPRVLRDSASDLYDGTMAADTTYVYWIEQDPALSATDRTASRLYRVSKDGGDAELLRETTDWFAGLGASDAALRYAVMSDPIPSVHAFEIMTGQRESRPLAEISGFFVGFVGDEVYWMGAPDEEDTWKVSVSPIEGGEATVLASIDGGGFVPFDRRLVVIWGDDVQYMTLIDRDQKCEQPLPSLGESVAAARMDSTHVYWGSYRNWIDNDDGPRPFLRTHLTTGVVEQLEVSGFEYTLERELLAQSDEALYFAIDGGIAVVTKP